MTYYYQYTTNANDPVLVNAIVRSKQKPNNVDQFKSTAQLESGLIEFNPVTKQCKWLKDIYDAEDVYVKTEEDLTKTRVTIADIDIITI